MHKNLFLVALSALIYPLSSAADAASLLMKMNNAFSEQDYDGVFTYISGDEVSSIRVVHKVVNGQQRERLVHMNGAPREILRKGEEVVCIVMPGDDLAVLEQSIPSGPFARAFVREFERLGNTYSLAEMGEGRVAGRIAYRVSVAPRDLHRYGYRLWLDAENHLLLRSQLIDKDGRRLEEFLFSTISFGDAVSDGALQSSEMAGSMISHLTLKNPNVAQIVQADTPTKRTDWRITWVPPGFEMASADIRRKPDSGGFVDSMIYSDGLATFSVFLEPMPARGAARMTSRNGATLAVARGIMGSERSYLATLVGEIPEATGTKIIESIQAR